MIPRHAVSAALVTLSAASLVVAGNSISADGVAHAKRARTSAAHKVAKPALNESALPQYVSLDTINRLRLLRNDEILPALEPLWDGKPLTRPMHDLLGDPSYDDGPPPGPQGAQIEKVSSSNGLGGTPVRLAQIFPEPIPPAPVRAMRPRAAAAPANPTPVIPHWVRYPLEFQLCGISLGTRAVDKDRFNRIDRYGLFALHGNPTAVVVPGAGESGNIAVSQQPPEIASIFPSGQGGGLPDWASAITVTLDNNHVEWLYRRDTYSMGFVVDRLGFVDAIVVAGVQCPIARTQLEDPVHTVKLGDDLRKVFFRYGYPDTIETYSVNVSASVSTAAAPTEGAGAGASGGPGSGSGSGAPPPQQGAPGPQSGPASGAPGSGGAANAGAESAGAGNGAFRTFEIRYEQSYNVVFTIRNNRVVRMYIFGDPDFFNDQHRQLLRVAY